MIRRILMVALSSVMLFFAGYSNAQAPLQEVKSEAKTKTKIVKLKLEIIKPRIYTNPRQSYAKPYANHARHRFPWGYCTWLVARKFPVTWSGNANMWITNARAQGYKISNTPKVSSIVQLREGWIGHVAYITNIRKNEFKIVEMNYRGFGVISYRWIPRNYWAIQGYIYAK